MPDFTNSATRLSQILKKAWSYNGDNAITGVWNEVFEVNKDNYNENEIVQRLTQLLILCNEAKDDIKTLELPKIEKYLKPIEKVETIFFRNSILIGQWHTIKTQISEEALDLIEIAGELLTDKNKKIVVLLPHDLELLHQEIKKLQDEIVNSTIDEDTKKFLIKELRNIEEIIINYRIRGSNGLEKVTKEVSGGIIIKLLNNLIPKEAQEITQKVFEKAIQINSLITLSERLSKLPEGIKDVMKFLPPGND